MTGRHVSPITRLYRERVPRHETPQARDARHDMQAEDTQALQAERRRVLYMALTWKETPMRWWQRADGGRMPKLCPVCGAVLSGALTHWAPDEDTHTTYSPCGCVEGPT